MRLPDPLESPTLHAALTAIGAEDHHLRPDVVEAVNTSLSVAPLPFGPGQWDIAVPLDALVVLFSIRSAHLTEQAGGMAGVTGIATRSSLEASTASLGGHGVLASGAYNAIYAKASAALNLSHKVFSSAGADISLSDAYLTLTGPTTRVLRLLWTNYSAGYRTLNAWAEIGVLG